METSTGTQTTLNKDMLSLVSSGNPAADDVLKDLANRQRLRRETNVDVYAIQLMNKGVKVVPENLLKFFKDLESCGAGALIYGRNGNHTRFKWFYSLKQVANAALHPEAFKEGFIKVPEIAPKLASEPKRRRKGRQGRPKGSKNKPKAPIEASREIVPPSIVASAVHGSAPEIVFHVKGKPLALPFDEAIILSNQVQALVAAMNRKSA